MGPFLLSWRGALQFVPLVACACPTAPEWPPARASPLPACAQQPNLTPQQRLAVKLRLAEKKIISATMEAVSSRRHTRGRARGALHA